MSVTQLTCTNGQLIFALLPHFTHIVCRLSNVLADLGQCDRREPLTLGAPPRSTIVAYEVPSHVRPQYTTYLAIKTNDVDTREERRQLTTLNRPPTNLCSLVFNITFITQSYHTIDSIFSVHTHAHDLS